MLGKRMQAGGSKARVASKEACGGGKPGGQQESAGAAAGASGSAPLPHTRMADTAALLPRYAAVARRSPDEPVGMEELDALQPELEALLCEAALRARRFRREMDGIDASESKREKRERGKAQAAGKRLHHPVKRKFPDERVVRPKEHARASNPKAPRFKSFAASGAPAASHSTFSNDNLITADNSLKLEMSQFAMPKNNVPYKFWTSVEPYCAPVTPDDVKFLESLLAASGSSALPSIPPLGRHYSEVWADEHVSEDQNASHPNNPNKQKSSGVSPDSASRKKVEKVSENMITGALTQRLVSALMEENAMPYEVPDIKVKQCTNTRNSFKNSLTLEKCLRKELVEQGILDPEDLPPLTSPSDDEILSEIKKCQAELTVVRKENCRNLRHLIGLCKQEMTRLNLKKQLDQVEAECIDTCKKILAAKQKKRPITKKEKDDAWRIINDQIRLNKEINALPVTGPNSI